MLPLSITAVWYCPVGDNDTDLQFAVVERAVQLTP